MEREDSITRREFIKAFTEKIILSGGILGVASFFARRKVSSFDFSIKPFDFKTEAGAGSFLIVSSKDKRKLKELLGDAFDRIGGIGRFISPSDKVLIKVNCGFARPAWVGATTSPEVVRAMVELCSDAGAKDIFVFDNPINTPYLCYEISGIKEAIESTSARIIYPAPYLCRSIEVSRGVIGRFPIFEGVLKEADKLVNIPTAKVHNLSLVSLAMKNLYGFFGGSRSMFHQKIHQVIAELAWFIRPTVNLLDATRLLIRNGPTGGSRDDVRERGIVAISPDIVAIDSFGCELLGVRPENVDYIRRAEKSGLGKADFREFDRFVEIRR